ncbi:MAG: hypothetical protein RR405_06030, partial [Clostridia bacterium]
MKRQDDYKVLIDYLKSNKIDFKCKSIFTENDCICIPSCDNMSISFHRCNRFFELWTVGITNIFYEDVLDDSTCAKVINIINNYKRLKQARVDY